MAKPHLKLITPAIENRTVTTPRRKPNAELRTREYLTEAEVEALIEAAKGNRHGHRDTTMILVTYRHGLRVSELVDLRWDQVDFNKATLAVRRAKQGTPATHPIMGDELRALRRLQREQEPRSAVRVHKASDEAHPSPQLALPDWWNALVRPLAWASQRPIRTCSRHACGFTLANKGTDTRTLQAYLGDKNIQHTVRYTELAPGRFKDIWRS